MYSKAAFLHVLGVGLLPAGAPSCLRENCLLRERIKPRRALLAQGTLPLSPSRPGYLHLPVAMVTPIVDQNSEGGKALQRVLQEQLKDYLGQDYSDDVLPLYIVVMLAHGTTQALVAENLEVSIYVCSLLGTGKSQPRAFS